MNSDSRMLSSNMFYRRLNCSKTKKTKRKKSDWNGFRTFPFFSLFTRTYFPTDWDNKSVICRGVPMTDCKWQFWQCNVPPQQISKSLINFFVAEILSMSNKTDSYCFQAFFFSSSIYFVCLFMFVNVFVSAHSLCVCLAFLESTERAQRFFHSPMNTNKNINTETKTISHSNWMPIYFESSMILFVSLLEYFSSIVLWHGS